MTLQRYKLTKLAEKRPGLFDIGYWVSGWGFEPMIGQSMVVEHVEKASVDQQFQWFHTSVVESIEGDLLHTMNSTWRCERLEAPAK
jgi:hypothetical protein